MYRKLRGACKSFKLHSVSLVKLGVTVLAISLAVLSGCASKTQSSVVYVQIPYSPSIQDLNSNYYVKWLSEKTGLDIELSVIRESRCDVYLQRFFEMDKYSDMNVDVILFGDKFVPSVSTISKYAAEGKIACRDDGSFFYPNNGYRKRIGCGQVLWINSDWLSRLQLDIPKTTQEFEDVLIAFRDNDANGNGLHDEIPLVGCNTTYAFDPTTFLLNSFAEYDPLHCGFNADGEMKTDSDEFRDGLMYCHQLYENDLLIMLDSFVEYSELLNSPGNYVGAFVTDSINDVIYPGNTDVLSKFDYAVPLQGPNDYARAILVDRGTSVGAIIPANAPHPEAAELLLSTMLSEEASLIAGYGEEGVDWHKSDGSAESVYGVKSTIVTSNYNWNSPQNKNLNGIGPMNIPAHYMAGVVWNGLHTDSVYMDADAKKDYVKYLPVRVYSGELPTGLSEYINSAVYDFVIGDKDISDDVVWNDYVHRLRLIEETP